MSTEVYLIRHGETVWNKERIVQGHLDSKLSTAGKNQAKLVGEKLKDYDFDVIYSSDLERAIDTANYINEYHNQVIIIDEMLRERKLGILEGKDWETIKNDHPEAASIYHSDDLDSEIPGGGESKAQFAERVRAFMDKIAIQEEGNKVLVITHGWLINFWIKLSLNIPLDDKNRLMYVENGSINKFLYRDGEWYLEKFNA
ncbi:MAG: histidine phosphatase family protein [Clostridia bacterium]|nr:histidine phosphatase family protein [Clostridia bacterium]